MSDKCRDFFDARLVRFLVHNIVVKRINIHNARTNLLRYLAELKLGGRWCSATAISPDIPGEKLWIVWRLPLRAAASSWSHQRMTTICGGRCCITGALMS